jgi:hypothetical protein
MCQRENGWSLNHESGVVQLKSLASPDVAFRATPQRLQPQIDRIGRLMSKVFDDSSMLILDQHNLQSIEATMFWTGALAFQLRLHAKVKFPQ